MQVNIAFAEQFAAARPYPYPVKWSIADEVFTRRGSLYFGTAHLLAYSAPRVKVRNSSELSYTGGHSLSPTGLRVSPCLAQRSLAFNCMVRKSRAV
jgi:hypothetical protein